MKNRVLRFIVVPEMLAIHTIWAQNTGTADKIHSKNRSLSFAFKKPPVREVIFVSWHQFQKDR